MRMRFLAIAIVFLTGGMYACAGTPFPKTARGGGASTTAPSPIASPVATVASATCSASTGIVSVVIKSCPSPGVPQASPVASTVTRVPSATGTDFVIVNNTGLPNSAVHFYVIGGGKYLQADGSLAQMGAANIPSLPLATAGPTVIPLPYMTSARIWISLNAPLQMSNGVQPGFGANVTQLYDFAEFNYGGGTLFIDTSQVDMFSLPMTIQVDNAQGSQIVGLPNGARTAIFSAFRADPVLTHLILTSGGTDLRILAPDHGIESGLIPATYIDAYVNQVWTYYQTHTLNLNGWTGTIVNGSLVFTQGGQTVTVQKPTGDKVFGCVLNTIGAIAPPLCAGLNRGTLIDQAAQPDYNAADFYLSVPTNGYAKIIHRFNINGKAYAFPYDDAGNFSSLISAGSPTTVTLTLSSF